MYIQKTFGRKKQTTHKGNSMDAPIPYRIWTFWSGVRSGLAEACIARMREANPKYQVVVLGDSDVVPTPGLENLRVQHISDWVRLCSLLEHGGIWLDATCICVTGVDAWVDHTDPRLQGFSAPWDKTVMENSALACRPGCPAVRKWRAEFQRAVTMGFNVYKHTVCARIRRQITGHFQFWPHSRSLPYLTMHAAFCVVQPGIPGMYIMRHGTCDPGSKSPCGPLRTGFGWQWSLLQETEPSKNRCVHYGLTKLMWPARDIISFCIAIGAYNKKGTLARLLHLNNHRSSIAPRPRYCVWLIILVIFLLLYSYRRRCLDFRGGVMERGLQGHRQ